MADSDDTPNNGGASDTPRNTLRSRPQTDTCMNDRVSPVTDAMSASQGKPNPLEAVKGGQGDASRSEPKDEKSAMADRPASSNTGGVWAPPSARGFVFGSNKSESKEENSATVSGAASGNTGGVWTPTARPKGGFVFGSNKSESKEENSATVSGAASGNTGGVWAPPSARGFVFGSNKSESKEDDSATVSGAASGNTGGMWTPSARPKDGFVFGSNKSESKEDDSATVSGAASGNTGGVWAPPSAPVLFRRGEPDGDGRLSRGSLGAVPSSPGTFLFASGTSGSEKMSAAKTMDAAEVRRTLVRNGAVVKAPDIFTEELELPYEVHSIIVPLCPFLLSRLRRVTVEAPPPVAAESPSPCTLHLLLRTLAMRLPKEAFATIRAMVPMPSCYVTRDAFKGGKHLVEVVLPRFVTTVGADAFEGCVRLQRVILPSSVTTITLSGSCLGSTGGVALAEGLKVNTTVSSIDLGSNNLRPEGGVAIAEALKIITTVSSVDLWYNNLGPEGGVAIAEALKVNTTVSSINLWYNNLGPESGVAIAEALKVNTTLSSIDLKYNKLGPEGGVAIAEALKVNTTVSSINLERKRRWCGDC